MLLVVEKLVCKNFLCICQKQWNLMYENARLQIGFFERFNLAANFLSDV